MTSLLPTNPKDGSEGSNHIAISQCALVYRYLPHQSGYGFFICIFNMRVQMYDCNAWTSYTSKIYNFKSNAKSWKTYKFTNKAKFRSYLASVNFQNLIEAIQITKLKWVDHIATFTCLYRRLTRSEGAPPIHKYISAPKQAHFRIKTSSKAIQCPNTTFSRQHMLI